MLVCICPVNCPRTIVLLLSHGPDISLNLFSILAISHIINLKAPGISYKLSLNNINYYLLPISNMQPGDTRPSTRLLYTPCKPVISLDLAVLLPQVQGDDSMQGRLVEEDLLEWDNNY